MSPTSLHPGATAVKSRRTRSGSSIASPAMVVTGRNGRGWHATRPSSRITDRIVSSSKWWPQRANWAWIRLYPEVPSEWSNANLTSAASSARRTAVADGARPHHS